MKNYGKTMIVLQCLLMMYSFASVFSKFAAGYDFLSYQFIFYYIAAIAVLGVYALGWQQILKRLPLTIAFINKAVTVVWGLIWGALFFGESITLGKITGSMIVIAGVILFATSDHHKSEKD